MGFQGSGHSTMAVAAVLIAVSIALAGCPAPGQDGDAALKIASLTPVTGELQAYGPSGQSAVALAVQDANDAGGVNGQDVQIAEGDTESTADAGVAEAQRLINTEGVHGIVGAYSSGVSGAVIDNIQTFGVPMISPASTNPALQDRDNNNLFMRTVATDALQGRVMAQLADDQNHTTIAILAINNGYGQGFADVVESTWTGDYGAVTKTVFYDPGQDSYDSTLNDLTTPQPDAVVFVGYPQSGVTIMQDAFQQDPPLAGPNGTVDWLFSEGFNDPSFPENVGQTQGGEYILAGYWGTTPAPMPQSFIDKYRDEYGSEPALFADGAYDAAAIQILASESCDCVSGSAYREALFDVANSPGQNVSDLSEGLSLAEQGEDIDYVGNANVEWDDQGDMVSGVYNYWRINDQGEIVIEQEVTP